MLFLVRCPIINRLVNNISIEKRTMNPVTYALILFLILELLPKAHIIQRLFYWENFSGSLYGWMFGNTTLISFATLRLLQPCLWHRTLWPQLYLCWFVSMNPRSSFVEGELLFRHMVISSFSIFINVCKTHPLSWLDLFESLALPLTKQEDILFQTV